jgi:predicted nucleic acid-binding protein
MPGSVFFDTNVLIYVLAQNDPRGPRAEALLAAGGMVGVQTLNEFVSVARHKMHMPWKDVLEALDAIRVLCPAPVPLTISTHETARKIAENHGYGIYEAPVIAAALEAHCATLCSEDLQDGQVIDGKLAIRNPFD